MVQILSRGNAAVKSRLSVNKELPVVNMEEETIVAQRLMQFVLLAWASQKWTHQTR